MYLKAGEQSSDLGLFLISSFLYTLPQPPLKLPKVDGFVFKRISSWVYLVDKFF